MRGGGAARLTDPEIRPAAPDRGEGDEATDPTACPQSPPDAPAKAIAAHDVKHLSADRRDKWRADLIGTYSYPDPQDAITSAAILDVEGDPGRWEESEAFALLLLEQQLAHTLPERDAVKALDAGCGEGRLLAWLTKFASQICALDPDSSRLRKAEGLRASLTSTIDFMCLPAHQAPRDAYRLLMCSHVIQHIHTDAVAPLLDALGRSSASDGKLILACSCAPAGQESYGLTSVREGHSRIEAVDERTFNDVASGVGRRGSVPFRRVDPAHLMAAAGKMGWRLKWRWQYHVMGSDGRLLGHRDEVEFNKTDDGEADLARDTIFLFDRERTSTAP